MDCSLGYGCQGINFACLLRHVSSWLRSRFKENQCGVMVRVLDYSLRDTASKLHSAIKHPRDLGPVILSQPTVVIRIKWVSDSTSWELESGGGELPSSFSFSSMPMSNASEIERTRIFPHPSSFSPWPVSALWLSSFFPVSRKTL